MTTTLRNRGRVSFSAGKTKFKRCIFPDRRRLFVFVCFSLIMALRDLRNLLLASHGDGLIYDDEIFVLYDLYSSKNPGFRVTFVFVWKLKVHIAIWNSSGSDSAPEGNSKRLQWSRMVSHICHLSGLRILKLDGSLAITSRHITTSWFEVHWKYLAFIAAENSMEISFSTGGNHWFRIRVRHLRKNYGNKIESEGVQFPGRGAPDKINRGG